MTKNVATTSFTSKPPTHRPTVVTPPPQQSAPPFATIVEQTGEHEIKAGLDRDRAREVCGSRSDDFNLTTIRRVIDAISAPAAAGLNGVNETVNAAMAALAAFKPTDEIEGMIAAHAVALHHAAMECFRRAALPAQHADTASKLRRDGANLARGFLETLEGMDRKRGKGPHVVRVERVVVQEGGQAIVGTVAAGVGSPGRGEG